MEVVQKLGESVNFHDYLKGDIIRIGVFSNEMRGETKEFA
jgi:hypothetical protein